MRGLLFGGALLLAAGCAQSTDVRSVKPARVRWEGVDGGWQPVTGPRYVNVPPGGHDGLIEWDLPAEFSGQNVTLDPQYVSKAQLDDRPVVTARERWVLLSVPDDQAPHVLRGWPIGHDLFISVTPPLIGPGASPIFELCRDEFVKFTSACFLIMLGVTLMFLSALSRAPVPLRSVGGIAITIGLISYTECALGRVPFDLPRNTWFVVHELAMLGPSPLLARFTRDILGDFERRALTWLMRVGAALFAVELVVAEVSAKTVVHFRAPVFALAAVTLVASAFRAWQRSRAGSRPALPLLIGVSGMLLSSVPGMFEALNLGPINIAASSYGALLLIVCLGWALAGADRDSALALRQRVQQLEQSQREVQSLNDELRRQVAEKSRALAASLDVSAPSLSGRIPAEGDVFAERYQVTRLLGKGGMGVVFEVRRLSDQRPLALKLMTGHVDTGAAARFLREAELAASFSHPNLVSVVDVGTSQSGTLYLAMELVGGHSLDRLSGSWTDRRWSLEVLTQVARGMIALHEHQVVHRDLKPANVLVDGELGRPKVKLTDFGIARVIANDPHGDTADPGAPQGADFTQTGATMGTPRYLPPDLVGNARAATSEVDAFSFGVMACEMLCGHYPFHVPPALEVMSGRAPTEADTAFLARSKLPERLTALLARCLALRAGQRPSATELLAALEEASVAQSS